MEACRNIRKKLSAYQDRELKSADKDAIEAHLHTCEACREKHEALLQTCQMLRSLPEIEAAPGLFRQIVDSAKREPEPFWFRAAGEVFGLLPARAAIVTLAASGLLIGTMLGNFLTKGQFHSSPSESVSFPEQALTLASIRVFDATPPRSFAEGYMQLVGQNPERSDEK